MINKFFIGGLILLVCLNACKKKSSEDSSTLFRIVHNSGIDFTNKLTETDSVNYFKYHYLYNGGGVAVGDINNDGLSDIYFTGNMVPNKLYLNKGNMQFEDITKKAGVAGDDRWVTGVTMGDINNDGLLDIYVSVAGKWKETNNLLFVNKGIQNGVPHFEEMAKAYGIDDSGNSTQAVFFDYDMDGDLDLFVANYPMTPFNAVNRQYKYNMDKVSAETSDRLYKNNGNGKFEDVTKASGLMQYGLTLGVIAADYNNDGFPDLYLSNDFASKDYFFFNNGDGTFTDKLELATNHTALYGMGSDAADINNDGLLDFIQVDMTPKGNRKSKANMASMNPNRFWEAVSLGLHYQYMQNVFQINNGMDNQGVPHFSDVAQMTDLALTDWSWAPLIVDLDNDGLKDVFITNGNRKDTNNKDYFKKIDFGRDYFGNKTKEVDYLALSKNIPSEKVANVVMKNRGGLSFSNQKDWGLNFFGYSNGASYADLDNDGDLDLIINNTDDASMVYENTCSDKGLNNYLRFNLKGPEKNPFGIGTKIKLENKGEAQYQYLTLTRGFQSSVEHFLHFGVGASTTIDEVTIKWPDGKEEALKNIATNKMVEVNYSNARFLTKNLKEKSETLFKEANQELGLVHIHEENRFDDFSYEILLPHKTSRYGPGLAVADINNDGLEDFFTGGATGFSGVLYNQKADGTFEKAMSQPWEYDKANEDIGAVFFDANGDGAPDLYVVSGGNEFKKDSPLLQDRLYINNGSGIFTKTKSALPKMLTSGSRVISADYDGDGDLDLFVGGRMVPRSYPLPANSYILENISTKGHIEFKDVTKDIAPVLNGLGMVTDAIWSDFDNDNDLDLIVVGEWMPITFLKNESGNFVDSAEEFGFSNSVGWWNAIEAADFDKDGDLDFVVGNLGLNYKYKASVEEPFSVYAHDFDSNGQLDIVLSYYNEGTQFPVRGKQCSSQQIPAISEKYKDYNEFAIATVEDVYSEELLSEAIHYDVTNFASSYIENLGNNQFKITNLPNEAQISSINDILCEDFDEDGYLDLLVAGNLYQSEVETPRNDASYGLFLKGNGKGAFNPIPYHQSGLLINGDTKDLATIKSKKGNIILAANNDDKLIAIKVNNKEKK
ncbi:VCBS repeat-containing protein [Mariniflexile litorale]|uniref:VCBS repeat-containing protein n=1 Tax=Mariniflexile litorale TaxID=3045158 RepID=A0AAU7EI87_9FLAO|nr:VCBS repeat-containing protein [Mariniflexile sp. KMM 9835]MDQ8211923.1 VCBS repeat-containing protein [Mariniflexile sp. KMM 9835]